MLSFELTLYGPCVFRDVKLATFFDNFMCVISSYFSLECKDSIRIFVSVRITVHEINTKIQNLTAKLELDFCCTRTHTHTKQDLVISVN